MTENRKRRGSPGHEHEDAVQAAREELNRAMRAMFARWGEGRIALPADRARAKEAVEEAENAFEAARKRLDALLAGGEPHLDVAALRAAVERLARALEAGQADPETLTRGPSVFGALREPVPGLTDAHWRHERAALDVDVWVLADARAGVVARITHSRERPGWKASVLNESTGELD